VPERLVLCEYVPSVHLADAPVGSVLLALPVVEVALVVVDLVVAAGAAAVATGAVAAGAAAVGVPTPPWCEQAPLPEVPMVPSLQVTGVPVDVAAAGAAAVDVVAAAGVFAVWVELVGVPTPP
jgi:hypothetical protein